MTKLLNLNIVKNVGFFLFFIIAILSNTKVFASHIVGGNLTYKYIGGTRYQVKLVLRRDCFLGSPEAQFDDPASIGIFSASGELLEGFENGGQLKIKFTASDTLNEFIRSDCGFEGTQVCVHETTYLGTINLPKRAGGYILAYQRCCRNNSINNIILPDETGSTYSVVINEAALNVNNSSPTFNQWPDVYICANKLLDFDHSATDIDGDSLVYKLCFPFEGATKTFPKPQPPNNPPYDVVEFKPPFSLSNLMSGVPLKIDPKTGRMTANPNLVGQFLIGVCVEEYRNGVFLGRVMRDFQYNVRVCSQPPLAQFTTSESNCDGLKVDFFNNSLSSSSYQWNFNFPNTSSVFTSTERNPSFTFPSSGVYQVRLKAIRVFDGCADSIIQTVSVFENRIVPDFGVKLGGCNGNLDSLFLQLSDVSSFQEPGYILTDRTWKVVQNNVTTNYTGNNPLIRVARNGPVELSFEVTASNGCKAKLSRTIDVGQFAPKLDFKYDFTGCPSNGLAEVVLTNLSGPLNPFATIDSTSWLIGNQSFFGNPLTITLPQNTKNFDVKLTTTFQTLCKVTDNKTFDLSLVVPQADYGFTPVRCPEDNSVTIKLNYIDTLSQGIAVQQINWSLGTNTNQNPASGNNVEVTIPKDSLLVFTLNATYQNGCVSQIKDAFTPGPFSQINFVPGPIIICPGNNQSIVTNPNPNWQYTWSPTTGLDLTTPSNPKVNATENTRYNVTVSDGLCQVTSFVDVVVLSSGVILDIEADTVTCDGKVNLSVTGGIGPGSYSWGLDPAFNVIAGTGPLLETSFTGKEQEFFVRYGSSDCATTPANVKVVNQAPNIEDVSPYKFCNGDTSNLVTFNVISEHINQFVWEADSHIVDGANTSSPTIGISATEKDDFILNYTATNQFGCELKDSVLFKIVDNPSYNFDFTLEKCGELKVCFDGEGMFDGFIQWDFGDPNTNTDVSLMQDPCYVYNQNGSYTVTLTNLVNVCPFKDVVRNVVVNPQIQINSIPDVLVCQGDSVSFKATSNISSLSYVWCSLNGSTINNTDKLDSTLTEDAQFVIKATDINGCVDKDTVVAKVFVFDYNIDVIDSLCTNIPSTIQLNLSNPEKYKILWSPADCIVSGGNTTTPTVIATSTKKITLSLEESALGCTTMEEVDLNVFKPFTFDVSAPEILCFDVQGQIVLSINNPNDFTYRWLPTDCFTNPNVKDPVFKITDDKSIKVIVTNKVSTCKDSLSFTVVAGENLNVDVDAKPDFTIYEGEDLEIFINNVNPNAVYEWSTNEAGTRIVVSPTSTTTYTVTATDNNGCTGTDEVVVTVRQARCDETDVYLPNAFTPNGDMSNDTFRVQSNFIDEMELIIYNRWGQQVFRSDNKNSGWDGKHNGKDLPPDAYAFYLRALCINAEEYIKKGNVNLIR